MENLHIGTTWNKVAKWCHEKHNHTHCPQETLWLHTLSKYQACSTEWLHQSHLMSMTIQCPILLDPVCIQMHWLPIWQIVIWWWLRPVNMILVIPLRNCYLLSVGEGLRYVYNILSYCNNILQLCVINACAYMYVYIAVELQHYKWHITTINHCD